MTKTPITLLNDEKPDALFKDSIYDPDIDGDWTEDSPKIIPTPGSLAIDRYNGGLLYYVSEVDDATYKSTLVPARIVITEEGTEVIKILSYGNDKYMLFYDDRVKPIQLNIDGKLRIFGSTLVEYRLVRIDKDKNKEIISLYIENNESYRGERIPLTSIGESTGAKILTNCHTLSKMIDGDTVEAEIYDNLGILSMTIELFTKRATILNDLSSETDIIVKFDAESNQMLGSDFYIHQRQDPAHLSITPLVKYSNGNVEALNINNTDCFLYGLEEFIPTFPGQRQKLLIKKFLSYRQNSPLAILDKNKKYISCEKYLTVIANQSFAGIKISIMPIWNATLNRYDLQFIAYSDRKDKLYDATPYVTMISTYYGDRYNEPQLITFDVNLEKLLGASATVPYRQSNVIELFRHSEYQKYLISDNTSYDPVYGVESSTIRRPVIMYDKTITQYFIPTSRFGNKEAFLDAFYYKANPPFDTNVSLDPIVPTHFIIRALDNLTTLITTPIEIAQYNQSWNINRTPENILIDRPVIVEFLELIGEQFNILYGVPVHVYESTSKVTDYNTRENNIK